MSTRATARHRASLRPATPLSTITGAVTDGAGTLGRGGVVIAMSSGLVATLGLPASAMGAARAHSEPRTAQIAALTLDQTGVAVPDDTPVTAPSGVTVSFERNAFSAAPAARARPRASARITPTTSRGRRTGDTRSRPAPFGSARGSSVLAVASRYLGVRYDYGGTDPSGWDCSGAMQYIFGQIGVSLPRTSGAQLASGTRVPASQARPGDLVGFYSGGHVYHIALYAGGGMIYDSGRTGSRFAKRAIWSSNVAYSRVLG